MNKITRIVKHCLGLVNKVQRQPTKMNHSNSNDAMQYTGVSETGGRHDKSLNRQTLLYKDASTSLKQGVPNVPKLQRFRIP